MSHEMHKYSMLCRLYIVFCLKKKNSVDIPILYLRISTLFIDIIIVVPNCENLKLRSRDLTNKLFCKT